MNPEGLVNARNALQNTLSESKITVYAETGAESSLELKEKAEDIKKQLDAENIQVFEDAFSMKPLLPTKPGIN